MANGQNKNKFTMEDAASGGASPISLTVTSAVPSPLGDRISCEHCRPVGG